ncbi:hypothetical protein EIP91_003548 [Steccherinum ochraceum]|uniref:Uncharacterized protein n=1 Tax=Steccherinum ochraceum TaxID=92696 RepID=A0A4R0RR01_9APHY|nr:hypothetical protein EIP91_003548 [Steccherinum ochraceum]
MDLGLKDVHVLVTGASGGIGLATTRLFLSQGALVSAHYRSNSSTLQPLTAEYPDRIRGIQADLESEAEVEKAFKKAVDAFGGHPVQVIVINHGAWESKDVPLAEMSLNQWNTSLSVLLTSPFMVAREFLKGLKDARAELKDKASIVMIGSTAGKYGEANHADYAACKSAMMYGLTLSLKNEIVAIAPKGRVNTVAPGWVFTPLAEEALKDPAVVYRSLATTPLKKFAQPIDIATQIVMLSSPIVSGHVTGQVVMVEGGMEGRLLNRPEDLP